MRAAAIDIGTNSTLALLAEAGRDGLVVVRDELAINQLGASLDGSGYLSRDVMALNVDYLNEIARDYRREGAEQFALCGTAALRRARNAQEFGGAIREILGLELEIISGRDEAALTFAGAISGREVFPHEQTGVIDLGGGSTEVIHGRGTVPAQSASLDLGAVNLTKEYCKHDPMTDEERVTLTEMLDLRLPMLLSSFRGTELPWTFVGGTAVSLAILKCGLAKYEPQRIAGTMLTFSDLEWWSAKLQAMHSGEIQRLPGMPLGRARFMPAGTMLLRAMFHQLGIEQATVSERGLRHGVWLAKFGN